MRRPFVLLALAALLMPAGAAAAPAQQRLLATPVVFRDAPGDSGSAADISSVRLTNDEQGQYTFDVRFATPYDAGSALRIYLNTDLNAATGDPSAHGADYVLGDDNSLQTFTFERWSGGWQNAPANATVSDSLSDDGRDLSLSVNRSELGNAAGFDFRVESVAGDGTPGSVDSAPASGTWRYRLQQVIRLTFVGGHSMLARAGGTWSVLMVVSRSDTGGAVGPEGRLACGASSGKTKLSLIEREYTIGGAPGALCTFEVPLRLRNRLLRATLTVSFRGQSVTHAFTTIVK